MNLETGRGLQIQFFPFFSFVGQCYATKSRIYTMDKACPCEDSLQDSAAPLKLRTVRKEYLQKKVDSKTSFYTHYVAYIFLSIV